MTNSDPIRLIPPDFYGREREINTILQLATKKRPSEKSQVLLIEGPGGIGKSMLLQTAGLQLRQKYPELHIVGPLDMDDTDYRLVVNTGQAIAYALGKDAFTNYLELSRNYQLKQSQQLDSTSIIIHMTMGDRVFMQDYSRFAKDKKIVIFADTIEAIRGTHIWSYFTRMVAVLPNTLFVLAGRPTSVTWEETRSFKSEKVTFERMPNVGPEGSHLLTLKGWSVSEARDFVRHTNAGKKLNDNDLNKLLNLSRCQPLHITLALDNLRRLPVFEKENIIANTPLYSLDLIEAESDVDTLPPDVPSVALNEYGQALIKQFERELLLHLSDTKPLSRIIRRLAHLRRRVNEEMYAQIKSFRPVIQDAPEWEEITKQPWIRHRADKYITLHDIVGELLREHIWPIRDASGNERQILSAQTVELYDRLIQELKEEHAQLSRKYENQLASYNAQPANKSLVDELTETHQRLLEKSRSLWVLQSEQLFYKLDADIQDGYRAFIEVFDEAQDRGELIIREMFLNEIETFIENFPIGNDEFYEITIRAVDSAIDDNLLKQAEKKLQILQTEYGQDVERQLAIHLRRGNLYLRIPEKAEEGLREFESASDLAPDDRSGEIMMEIGWANRQLGRWQEASKVYQQALDHTSLIHQELRSQISKNLAYVEALIGEYDAARTFINTALSFYRDVGDQMGLGSSLSVQGEIFRYQQEFEKANKAYDEALAIFSSIDHPGWLGLVHQEKAICLIQEDEANLEDAYHHIQNALYLCEEYRPRDYAAALNRAGRVYEAKGDHQKAFEQYEEGVEAAKVAQDNWFLMANIVEHAELAFKMWQSTQQPEYRVRLERYQDLIENIEQIGNVAFKDLFGRWHLVKGHFAWFAGLQAHANGTDTEALKAWSTAMKEYGKGFPLIADGHYGSHGIRALPREGKKLETHLLQLPTEVAKEWCVKLNEQWSAQNSPALLSAILSQAYGNVLKREREGVNS